MGLANLKQGMTCVCEHVWHHMREGWKKEHIFFFCARAATLLFWGSKGQRREKLGVAAKLLPAGCVVHG